MIVLTKSLSTTVLTVDAGLNVYPNPVKDKVHINYHVTDGQRKQIRLVNLNGEIIQTIDAGTASNGTVDFWMANKANGLYTVELISGGTRLKTTTFIKQ